MCHMSLSQCHAAGHPPASREKVHGSQACPVLTASSPLQAAPCLSLHHWPAPCWSSWGSRESCTGTPGSGARKGGKRRKMGPVQEDCPDKSIPKEKSWKGREYKKAWRISEARWLSCLVRWKPARVLCLTGRCENNPCAKPVRVALGPKKVLSHFVYVVKQDFQSVWEWQHEWREAGRRGGALGCPLWVIFSASILQGRALGSEGESLGQLTWFQFLQRDCSSPNILCFSDVLGRLTWALALYKGPRAPLYFLKTSNCPCCGTEVSLTGVCLRQALLSPGEDWTDVQEPS